MKYTSIKRVNRTNKKALRSALTAALTLSTIIAIVIINIKIRQRRSILQ